MDRWVYCDNYVYETPCKSILVSADMSKKIVEGEVSLEIGEYLVVPDNEACINSLMALDTFDLINGEEFTGLPLKAAGARTSNPIVMRRKTAK